MVARHDDDFLPLIHVTEWLRQCPPRFEGFEGPFLLLRAALDAALPSVMVLIYWGFCTPNTK